MLEERAQKISLGCFTIGFPDFVAQIPIDLLSCQNHAYPYAIL
jgi:hypothetical protein